MANVSRSSVDAIVYRKLNGFATFADKDEFQLIEATKNFGPTPDTAVIRLHPTTPFSTNRHFADSLLRAGKLQDTQLNSTLIQVVLRGNVALGDTVDRVVHYGRPVNFNAKLSEKGEELLFTSRFDWHMWGDIVRGANTIKDRFDVVTPTVAEVAGNLIFNPEINGRLWPNKWDTKISATYHPFVHPMALRRSNFAQGEPTTAQLNAEAVDWWQLIDVVEYLCAVLNPSQTHIDNPTSGELTTAFAAKTDLIKNLVVPKGLTLPEALHLVLEPLGWSFYVNYINNPNINNTSRRIAFVERHKGAGKFLRMQDYGDTIDYTQTNVESVDIDMDVTDGSTNNPVVEATPEFVETTITLIPAWNSSKDGTLLEDLKIGSAAMLADPTLTRVWRDWVANETGEYTAIRAGNTKLDLDAVLGSGTHVERRRRLLPMITSRPDGTPLGQHRGMQLDITINGVESDSSFLEKGGSWKPLRDEIGIRFDGVLPPAEMYAAGVAGLTVKVTGVIQGDKVFDKESSGVGSSLIFETKPEHIDMRDRYIIRRVDSTSKHSAAVIADTINHTEIDDSTDLQALANEILEQWDHASTRGTVTLKGVDWVDTVRLGDAVKGLGDRGYGLETTHPLKVLQKYPLIIGVRFRYDTQQTVLVLDARRSPVLLPLRRRR